MLQIRDSTRVYKTALQILTITVCGALAACSSTPTPTNNATGVLPKGLVDRSEVTTGREYKLPGDRVYVELNFVERDQRLALVNSGSTKPADVYSQFATPGLSLKVSDDLTMAKLYEAMRILKFAELAETAAPAQAIWSLTIDVDGAKRTVYNARGRTAERHAQVQDLLGLFMEGFNRTLALQKIDPGKGGKSVFTLEEQRIQQENAKKKLEKK
ncbi:MAG: hypothetical protein ACKVS6_17055 [Planctomycetota bacterium]